MKAKMDEIDEIWVICRRNLGQNRRWNINLLLKINFSRWIKNWEQSGRWIAILLLESHLDRRINTGVIWAVRSRCMKEGKYHQKITDISSIYHRYIIDFFATRGDFLKESPIYLPERIYRRYIADILAIFKEISPLRFFSMKYRVASSQYKIYRRYIPIFSSMISTQCLCTCKFQICMATYAWPSFKPRVVSPPCFIFDFQKKKISNNFQNSILHIIFQILIFQIISTLPFFLLTIFLGSKNPLFNQICCYFLRHAIFITFMIFKIF